MARSGGSGVGSAAPELYGSEALLRPVPVEAGRRGEGPGRRLALAAPGLARRRGVADVYLLPETDRGYFPRLGFRPFDRALAPASVRGSVEFASACPEGAALMVARLA